MNNGLPQRWAEIELRECVDVLDNQRVPVNSDERAKRQGDVPYYGATGQVGWIDEALFNEELLLIGEDGAPFFDKSKPISYIIRGKSWVNNHAHVLRARSNVSSNQYLKHFLDSFDFHEFVNGTTRLKLTQGAMNRIPVRLAPLGEQWRMVAKLEKLLGKVDACQQRLAKIPVLLKRFRQSILAAACSGLLTADWREEDRVDGTNDDDLPSHWVRTSVGDVLESLKYGTATKCGYERRGVPVLRIPNVVSGMVDHTDLKFAELPTKELNQLRLVPGDLLLVRSNGSVSLVGRTAVVREEERDFAYAGYLIRLRPNRTKVDPDFLNLALASFDMRLQIELEARSTSGVNNINSEEVQALQFSLPPPVEQDEIVRRVGALFALADQIEARYAKAKAHVGKLTPSLLAKAFRGELVPQNPNDEPAEALLRRIRQQSKKGKKT